jgi:hypothetical protein
MILLLDFYKNGFIPKGIDYGLPYFYEKNTKKTSITQGRIPSAVCNRAQCAVF